MEEVTKELTNDSKANELPRLGAQLDAYPTFLDELAECIKTWGIETCRSVESLQRWAITFAGAVFGSAPSPSPSSPYPFGYNAFTSSLSSLSILCVTLQDDIQMILKHLHELKERTKNPKQLFNEMHALRPFRISSESSPRSRRRDNTSTLKSRERYLLLQSQLSSELPRLLDTMDRVIGLVIGMVTEGFLKVVKEKWINLFNSMMEEGERYDGIEETSKAWQAAWEVGMQEYSIWNKISLLGDPRPSAGSQMSLPVWASVRRLAEQPPMDGEKLYHKEVRSTQRSAPFFFLLRCTIRSPGRAIKTSDAFLIPTEFTTLVSDAPVSCGRRFCSVHDPSP